MPRKSRSIPIPIHTIETSLPSPTNKVCIPGFICFETITFIFIAILTFMVGYLYYALYKKEYNPESISPVTTPVTLAISTRNSPEYDGPPLRNYDYPRNSGDIRGGIVIPPLGGLPINIETRGTGMEYTQIGILTRLHHKEMILPLMGRKLTIGLDKWQYYTVSNTGVINTRLPIRFHGRSCTSENGCDCLNTGDQVYVEGYDDVFKATIYENTQFRYIPYI